MTRTEAAVLVGPRRFEVQDFDLPVTDRDSGLLEIEACGICGSDIAPYLAGGAPIGEVRQISTPVVLGHEMVGRIVAIGADAARRWKVSEGDRVVVERWLPCGRCAACQAARFASCYRFVEGAHLFYGGTPTTVKPSLWGGFARHMYLHQDSLVHRVSSDGPAGVFTMFLPLGNAISWLLESGSLRMGGSLLIEGPGPIGLMGVLVARAAGARVIVVSGLTKDQARLALARELGATHTVDASTADVVALCRDLTGGAGVDVVVDVTNGASSAPVATALTAAHPGGRVVLAGEYRDGGASGKVARWIQERTLTVVGVRGRSREAAATALELLGDPAWAASLKRLSDPVVPLDRVADGFEALLAGQALHASIAMPKT